MGYKDERKGTDHDPGQYSGIVTFIQGFRIVGCKGGGRDTFNTKTFGFEAVSNKFSQAAAKKGITLENLLKDLKDIRHKES